MVWMPLPHVQNSLNRNGMGLVENTYFSITNNEECQSI